MFMMHLVVRDYRRLWAYTYGSKIFSIQGPHPHGMLKTWSEVDHSRIDQWKKGNTGLPIVDACMRELSATGFMSNRGRQIVANYLVNTLGIDWRYGAYFFEEALVDHDVHSNYGAWAYIAGVGPHSNYQPMNLLKQSLQFDSEGLFIRKWIPELGKLSHPHIHAPWTQPSDC